MHTSPGLGNSRPGDVIVVWGTAPRDERQAAHTALVRAAAAMTGCRDGRIGMRYESSGRPRLTGPAAGLEVSVSHSRGAFAVALSAVLPVGVDVETVRVLPAVALARRWFDGAAATAVAATPHDEQIPMFLRLWTQKEAIGKSRGLGLRRGGLRQPVPVSFAGHVPAAGRCVSLTAPQDTPDIFCAALTVGAGRHVLSIAAHGDHTTGRVTAVVRPQTSMRENDE